MLTYSLGKKLWQFFKLVAKVISSSVLNLLFPKSKYIELIKERNSKLSYQGFFFISSPMAFQAFSFIQLAYPTSRCISCWCIAFQAYVCLEFNFKAKNYFTLLKIHCGPEKLKIVQAPQKNREMNQFHGFIFYVFDF